MAKILHAALNQSRSDLGIWNLEGYARSLPQQVRWTRRRPHISRIERGRGPVSRYGESDRGV